MVTLDGAHNPVTSRRIRRGDILVITSDGHQDITGFPYGPDHNIVRGQVHNRPGELDIYCLYFRHTPPSMRVARGADFYCLIKNFGKSQPNAIPPGGFRTILQRNRK